MHWSSRSRGQHRPPVICCTRCICTGAVAFASLALPDLTVSTRVNTFAKRFQCNGIQVARVRLSSLRYAIMIVDTRGGTE